MTTIQNRSDAIAKRRAKNRKILAQKSVGNEPVVDQQENLGNALNYYSANFSTKDYKKWALEWYKKADKKIYEKLKLLEDWNFLTFGPLCRLQSREMWDPKKSDSLFYGKRLTELLARAETKVVPVEPEKEPAKVISVQDRILMQARELAAEIDGEVDAFTTGGYKSSFTAKGFLAKNQVSGPVAKRVGEFYHDELQELKDAYNQVDEQLVEGYSHLSRRELKRFIDWMQSIVDDCEQMVQTAKANRAPRKRKPVSPQKVVSRVKYLQEFPELKLTSIKPVDMLESKEIWIYNTKYKKVQVYCAEVGTLFVKGTSIVGFDTTSSVSMTLRKPEEFFKGLSMGKRALTNALKSLKTKPAKPNGRLNEHCIILGAF